MNVKVKSFFKTYWQMILIIILAIIVISQIDSCRKNKQTINALKTKLDFNDSSSYSQIKVWKDKYGKEHSKAESEVVTSAAMKVYADSVSKLLNIKSSQVTLMSKTISKLSLNAKLKVDTLLVFDNKPIDTTWSYRIDSAVYIVDTTSPLMDAISIYNFHFDDYWMQVRGSIGGGRDSIHITGTDTLSRVDYKKRKWFLGPTHYYVDFSNSNPYIKTTGYKGVSVKPDVYHWSIGPALGVGYYDFTSPKIWVGFTIQRSLIRF